MKTSQKIKIGILIPVIGLGLSSRISNSDLNSPTEIENPIPVVTLESVAPISNLESVAIVYKAPPFYYPITEHDRHVITCVVAGEAEGESMEGKMAVAQTILNSLEYESINAEGILYKFDGWNEELEFSNPEVWGDCVEAVSRVFDDGEMVLNGEPLWFYNRNVMYSKWHEESPNLEYIGDVGAHSFFALKK